MPQVIDLPEISTFEDEFDLSDLDLGALVVVSMHDPAAKPEAPTAAAWSCSCCCYPVEIQ